MVLPQRAAADQPRERRVKYWLCQRCFTSSAKTSRVRQILLQREKTRTT